LLVGAISTAGADADSTVWDGSLGSQSAVRSRVLPSEVCIKQNGASRSFSGGSWAIDPFDGFVEASPAAIGSKTANVADRAIGKPKNFSIGSNLM
jgi:hypothetical protein